ncbi:uncharacterized protein LOC132200613 isoform X2 [Neocloeon triangulifer]|uniref:uncharacterized protein LOC132200613 isoform X2 n=1 Tax=Neocloeon triangulifer TaxID=2078957 RepID=UPI00286F125D|nr:uncharacterized protein LOC132200613 isoform X2 [Neocloeon triangulifer]
MHLSRAIICTCIVTILAMIFFGIDFRILFKKCPHSEQIVDNVYCTTSGLTTISRMIVICILQAVLYCGIRSRSSRLLKIWLGTMILVVIPITAGIILYHSKHGDGYFITTNIILLGLSNKRIIGPLFQDVLHDYFHHIRLNGNGDSYTITCDVYARNSGIFIGRLIIYSIIQGLLLYGLRIFLCNWISSIFLHTELIYLLNTNNVFYFKL